jgi:hypothetical protein
MRASRLLMVPRLSGCTIVLIAALGAHAQSHPASSPQGLTEELGLSDAQVDQLNRMDQAYAKSLEALHSEGLSAEAKQWRAALIRDEHANALRALLNAAQWERWQLARKQARDAAYDRLMQRKEEAPHQE